MSFIPWALGISGRDDAYNTIEGLRHGGKGERTRRELTPFGSGWDPLRALAKSLFGEGKNSFRQLTRLPEFKQALASAKDLGRLGGGGFGDVYLMEGVMEFGGQKHTFKFARKVMKEKVGKFTPRELQTVFFEEAKNMVALQDLNVPSVYGLDWKNRQMFMEVFEGTEAGTLSRQQLSKFAEFVTKSEQRGIVNQDLYRVTPWGVVPHNVMITNKGDVGVIDTAFTSKSWKRHKWGTQEWEFARRNVEINDPNPSAEMIGRKYNEMMLGGLSTEVNIASGSGRSSAGSIAAVQHSKNVLKEGLESSVITGKRRSVVMAAKTRKAQRTMAENAIRGGKRHTAYTTNTAFVKDTYEAYASTVLDPFASTLLVK